MCHERDTRNVAGANDAERQTSYSRNMTDRTRKGHTMKRIATIAAVLTTAAIVAPVAAAGNISAQIKPQISAQIVGVQVAKVQRANAAVTLQRISSQRANARRFSILLQAQIR